MFKLSIIFPLFVVLFISGCKDSEEFKALENKTEYVCKDGTFTCKTMIASSDRNIPIISVLGPCKIVN